ncbi:MAG: LD-carboxypeptidase [Planctomycetota bacterium]
MDVAKTPGRQIDLLFSSTLLLACFICRNSMAETPPVKPRALHPGDTIMFVAPAGELDRERIGLAARRLNELGYRTIVPENLFRQRGYLAGSDQERADELMQAFIDPEVDAIFPGTGGYGVTRMLDLLDWEVIRQHPKIVIGFSDITALHLALAAKAKLVTFHSPNPQWGLGSEENLMPLSEKYFWRNLRAKENASDDQGFVYDLSDFRAAADESHRPGSLRAIRPGKAEGRLIGGNLSLVAALIGTPYEAETSGKVLFLEDVNEEPYRIDRMLSQLKLSGQLDACAAVLLGQFSRCEAKSDRGLSLAQVFDDYFADAPYPVVANFPAGHVRLNATLPLGCRVRVDADELLISVLENPVVAD